MSVSRSQQLNIRLTSEEYATFVRTAEAMGLTVSAWARMILRHSAGLTVVVKSPRGEQ